MDEDRRPSGPPLPPGPGGALPALLSVALVAFLLAGLMVLGSLLEWLRPGGLDDPVNLLFLALVSFPLTILVGLRVDPAGSPTMAEGLTVRYTRASTAVLALSFGLAAVVPLAELDNMLLGLFPMDERERTALLRLFGFDGWLPQLAKVFAIAVVTPIGEELVFRGLVLRWLRRSYGRFVGITVSAILFGFAHISLRHFLPTLLLGLAFGWFADRSRSVLPSIGAHASYNAVPFLVPPALADVPGLMPSADAATGHLPVPWVIGSSVACLALLYGVWWTTLRRD